MGVLSVDQHRARTEPPLTLVRGNRGDGVPAAVDIETAYRDLAPAVLGYLRGNGLSDPENVLGEVFLAVARGLHGFEGDDAALRRWVFTIAHHRRVDAHRRRARRPLVVVAEVPEPAPAPPSDLPDPDLVAALAALPFDQRTVLLLRFEADMPLADVATVLGRSTDAVKKLQARGLINLRRVLVDGESAVDL